MLSHWRFDPFWIVLLIVAAWWYISALRKLEATNPRVPHPRWKMWSFIGGLVLIAIATMSPMQHYGNVFLFMTFVGFIVISMVAPIFLLLASPLTLAFRTTDTQRGRARLRWLYRNPISTVLTYPLFSWLAFAVVTYVWQFSKLTEIAARNGAVRDIELLTMLFIGILFYFPALCADPVRWRMNFPLRIFYVFVEVTHKALFGGMFTSMSSVFHPSMAKAMPNWGPDPLFDQRIGVLIVSAVGNAIFITVIAFLVARWVPYETRVSARTDKRLEKERAAAERKQAALEQVFRRTV
jgi:putative copper resistance protein D